MRCGTARAADPLDYLPDRSVEQSGRPASGDLGADALSEDQKLRPKVTSCGTRWPVLNDHVTGRQIFRPPPSFFPPT